MKKNDKKVEEKNVENVEKEIKKDGKELIKIPKVKSDSIAIASVVTIVLLLAAGIIFFLYYTKNNSSVIDFDGGKVSKIEFETYYKTFAPLLTTYYGYPEDQVAEEIAKKAAIDKIVVAEAKAAGVTLSEEDKAEIEEVFNDEDRIKTFTESNIDIDTLKKVYESDYIISSYMEKLADELSDDEMKEYITSTYGETADLYEYDTSHILFKTIDDSYNPLSDEEKKSKKQKAEEVLKKALAGEDFANLAKEYSEDTTAEEGGKFIMYMDGSTVTQYSDAVKKLKDGEITTTLVESDYGYHIIKLNKKVENGRLKNATERETYVSEKINKLAEEKNINIKTDLINKIVEEINSSSSNANTDNSDDATENSEDATTQESESTEETSGETSGETSEETK